MLPDLSSELALQVLRLERRLDSYQRLHEQELDDLRRAVAQATDQVLILAAAVSRPAGAGFASRETDHPVAHVAEPEPLHPTAPVNSQNAIG